jgi:hypothetical protein
VWDELTDEMRVFCSMSEMENVRLPSLPNKEVMDIFCFVVHAAEIPLGAAPIKITIMLGRSRNGQGRDVETDGHDAMPWEVVSGPLWFEQWTAN